MPLTAPDVTGTANYRTISFRYIDHTGDQRAVASIVPAAATSAQIQALAVAAGAASNANLWEIQVGTVFSAIAASKALATEAVYPSVYDNIVILQKGDLGASQRTFIPAPIEAIMDGDDQPNPTNALLIAFQNAFGNVINAGTEQFVPVSVRFTERKEKNEAVKY